MKIPPSILVGAIGAFGVPTMHGATWVLLNGDRVSGRLVSESAQAITIEHPALGRVTLPRSALAVGQSAKVGAGNVPAVAKDQGSGKIHWKREVEFGFSDEAGRASQQNLSARVQFDGVQGPDTYQVIGRLTQIESRGIVSADQRELDARWRHQLNARIFAQTLTTWSAEPVRGLEQNVEQQVGGGLRLSEKGPTTANVGVGAAVRYQERTGLEAATSVLGTVFHDFSHAFRDGIKFSEDANVGIASDRPYSPSGGVVGAPPVPAAGGNYRVRFNTLLQGKVTQQVTFNLRYVLDYDRSVPDPDARLDRRLTTSLGYAW